MPITLRLGSRHLVVDLRRETDARFTARVDDQVLDFEAVLHDVNTLHITIGEISSAARVVRVGNDLHVAVMGEVYVYSEEGAVSGDQSSALASPKVIAPMPGKVLQIFVKEGQKVEAGDDLLILEAMKMENRMSAEASGIVRAIHVEEGQGVDGGTLLLEMEYSETA